MLMLPETVLDRLAERNILLWQDGDNIYALGNLTDSERELIRLNKQTLLQHLSSQPPTIEGIPLDLIMRHADPEDYADLQDPKILAGFARALLSSATITPADIYEYHRQQRLKNTVIPTLSL